MSPDAVETDKVRDEKETKPRRKSWMEFVSRRQMLLALALLLVAIAGLCWISGLSNILRPLPPPTATRTPLPTFTPRPTVTLTMTPTPTATATPEPQVMPGVQVTVSGTVGQNLRLRAGPGLTQETLSILEEGTRLTVLEGSEAADGYEWWKVRTDDGQEGWVAGNWLIPVVP